MIGGFYVMGIMDNGKRKPVSLIAGPFADWNGANQAGPLAIKYVTDNFDGKLVTGWNICEFYAPELMPGILNKELWVTPKPIERL